MSSQYLNSISPMKKKTYQNINVCMRPFVQHTKELLHKIEKKWKIVAICIPLDNSIRYHSLLLSLLDVCSNKFEYVQ